MTGLTPRGVVDPRDLQRDIERANPDTAVEIVQLSVPLTEVPECEEEHRDARLGAVEVWWMPTGGTTYSERYVCAECAPWLVRDLRDYERKVIVRIGAWA